MNNKHSRTRDRIRGCLTGGAVGDALGYPVEFLSRDAILSKYGENGITRYELNHGVAEISDDTQMTLYTAAALVAGKTALHRGNTDKSVLDFVQEAYLEWSRTQFRQGHILPLQERCCAISGDERLYAVRAPGNTCLGALEQLASGLPVDNNSCGCGGIMRVAPVALAADAVPDNAYNDGFEHVMDTDLLGSATARLTHLHPWGHLPAALFTHILYRIIHADGSVTRDWLVDTLYQALYYLDNLPDPATGRLFKEVHPMEVDELHLRTMRLVRLSVSTIDPQESLRKLGEGWTGDEAYYIALYCMLRHPDDFEAAVTLAVNHSGDSDSTGALCGNLMGALVGYERIPHHFKDRLELSDLVLTLADDLYTVQCPDTTEAEWSDLAVRYLTFREGNPLPER